MSDWIYSDREWEDVKDRVGHIESSNRYDIRGGYNNAYIGRYQLGKQTIKEASKSLGIIIPEDKDLMNNPDLQDRMWKSYLGGAHNWLKNNSNVYRNMDESEQKRMLPMAQFGAGNVKKLLDDNIMFKDANGTPITKYRDAFKGYQWDSDMADVILLDPITVTPLNTE